MPNLSLSRIDRIDLHIPVTATLADSTPADLAGVDVALLAPRTTPTAATTWTSAAYTGGVAVVLVAGPDADPTGALAIPAGGADVWLRVVDNPEVQAVCAGRVTIA